MDIRLVLIIILISFAFILKSQTDSLAFPFAWQGEWQGDLVISNGGGELQRLPMILRLFPLSDSSYTYSIVYGEDTPDNTRPYILIQSDPSKGHYKIDEGNGIVIDDFFINNKLYSRFEVMGSLLLATLEKRGDYLIYEIISGPLAPIQTTGNTVFNGEEIPIVNNYGIHVQQQALLTKMNQ